MPSFEETGPRAPVTESIRVDKVRPKAQFAKKVRAILVIIVAIILLVPVAVMVMTAFKSRADVVTAPPKIFFEPTVEGLVFLLTERSQLGEEALEEAKANADNLGIFDRVALENGQRINGPSDFLRRLRNSIIIAAGATLASVTLGLFAAYAFSRFEIPGANDLLFFYSKRAHAARRGGHDSHFLDVPPAGLARHTPGDDPRLYRLQPVINRLAAKRIYRRDPQGI